MGGNAQAGRRDSSDDALTGGKAAPALQGPAGHGASSRTPSVARYAGIPAPDAAALIDEARVRLTAVYLGDVGRLERAVQSGDENAVAHARAILGTQIAWIRQSLRDAEDAAGDDATVRVSIPPMRAELDVLEARCDAMVGVCTAGAGKSAQVIPFRGAGGAEEVLTSAPADLGLSDDHLDFSATELGRESAPEALWIRNLGDHDVSLDAVTGPSEFPVHGESRAPLAPGEATRVDVSFRPQETGRRTGTLRIETDDGIRSARVRLTGRGVEATAATEQEARTDRLTAAARSDALFTAPCTFTAMRDLLHAARALEEVGDRERALRAVTAVDEALRDIANPARAHERFREFGFGRQTAESSLGAATGGVRALAQRLASRAPVAWSFELAQFEVGREAIELLTGEANDSASFRAQHRGGKLTLGLLGGTLGALALGPLVVGELGLLLEAGAMAYRSTWLWGVANPGTATAVAAAGTGIAIDMADKGGPSAWAETAKTPEGALSLVIDALQVYDAHINTRSSPRPASVADGRDSVDMFVSGAIPPAGPARWRYIDEPDVWAPERRALHDELIVEYRAEAQALADGAAGSRSALVAMRGNTAAGKSRALRSGHPDLAGPVAKASHGTINPDNFKSRLMSAGGLNLTSSQVHSESSMLAGRLERELLDLRITDSGALATLVVDKRLASIEEVLAYADIASRTGRRLELIDVDAPLAVSLAGVLERLPGRDDPLPPFDVIAKGFVSVRRDRKAVIDYFQSNPDLGTYQLFATRPDGSRVKAAEVRGGVITVFDAGLFETAMDRQVNRLPEVTAGTMISTDLIRELTGALPPDRARAVKAVLGRHIGQTWQEAVDAQSALTQTDGEGSTP